MPTTELYAWVQGRPKWQQEIARRICEQGTLTDDDYEAIHRHLEVQNGLRPDEPSPCLPLQEAHLADRSAAVPRTVLCSIGPLKGIDRLATGQKPMQFAINGITLVYGANGSGKSGYCRIAKKICRCLHEVKLRGNVFEATDADQHEITVKFKVEGGGEPRTIVWREGDEPPPELARISVFDTSAGSIYVDDERTIEVLPFELDLVTKLGQAVRVLDQRFEQQEISLNRLIQTALPSGYTPDTKASNLIRNLAPTTTLERVPSEEELREAGKWSPDLELRLQQLSAELSNDPKALALGRRRAKAAILAAKNEIEKVHSMLGDEAVIALDAKRENAAAKRALAHLIAHDTHPELS